MTVFFDLDGTLVDSRPGILACFRHTFDVLQRNAPSEAELAASIGRPFRAAMSDLLGTDDAPLVEQAVAVYRQRYGDIGLYEATVYDRVPEMLAGLGGRHAYLATSKAQVYAARVVQHFGLASYFQRVYGPDLSGQPTNKTALLRHILAEETVTGAAVMVGDRAEDIRAAAANGLVPVGVLWGYGDRTELHDAGAETVCATPDELLDCLARLSG